jgi:MYXO-CTERM domain-containing protein
MSESCAVRRCLGPSTPRVAAFCLGALAALAVTAPACDSAEPRQAFGVRRAPFTTGYGPARGHEDILRFGVDFANDLLEEETGDYEFFPRIMPGEDCVYSTNQLVLGNGATDFPDELLAAFYGVDTDTWHTAPTLQNLHFLRNYVGTDDVETAREACVGAEQRVINATRRAGEAWRDWSESEAYYWIGHATHILQDSFASPHTLRMGTGLRTLVDVCTYDREIPGVCYHSTVALGDRIWQKTVGCQLNPDDRSWDCLTPEAQAAAFATTGYLLVVGRWLGAGTMGDISSLLEAWFTGAEVDPYSGYLSCASLDGLWPGEACDDDRICDSDACVDGVCCADECGVCEVCDAAGLEGVCTSASAGTDPHDDCTVPGGDPLCAGTCDGSGACAYPGSDVSCGLCAACDGRGDCLAVPADDAACGIIECSGLDTPCRAYADRIADRCAALGRCLEPDTASACTEWWDLACAADATDTASDGTSDGAPDAEPDVEPDGEFDGWPPPSQGDSGCSCATAAPRSPWMMLALLAGGALLAILRRR